MADNNLKVLHICQRDDPATGGAARVAVEYIKRLPDYEIDARCLFLYGEPGYFGSELKERASYLQIANSREVLKFGRLAAFIRHFKPQILHHHDGLLWVQLLTFAHPGIVKICHAHLQAIEHSLSVRGNMAAKMQRASTDLLLCITKDTQASYLRAGGYSADRTQVLYNGVDRQRFYPASPQQKLSGRERFGIPTEVFVVGYVGRLHCEMKGTDDFLKTMALLPANFWALIVGDGIDAERLKSLAADLQISSRVIFAGMMNDPTLAYHVMDVFCLTSHYEPFGLVVAEAMACQLPVVGFACEGGVREILNAETGVAIANRNLVAMAAAIESALKQPNLWEQRQQNALDLIDRHHNWDKNTVELSKIYRHIIVNS